MRLSVLSVVIIVLSVIVCDIFTVKMCVNLTSTFKLGQGQMQTIQFKVNMRLHISWRWQCLPYLSPFIGYSRINFPKYSIRIFDIKNEGQLRWRLRWKLAYELALSTCIRLRNLALLRSVASSRWHFVSYVRIDGRTHNTSSHNTVQLEA